MNIDVIFLYTIYIASIVVHFIALFVAGAFVIPLQIKEAQVQNGLKPLRIQMLASGLILMSLSVVSIIALTLPLLVDNTVFHEHPNEPASFSQYLTIFVVFLHSLGFLAFAFIKKAMYHSQYSEVSKERHVEVARIEREDAKSQR